MITILNTDGKMINGVRSSKVAKRIIAFSFAGILFNCANGQSGKTLALADEYFKAGEYVTAAGLYNQFLHPVVKEKPFTDFPLQSRKSAAGSSQYLDKTAIIYKQAESYRLANYFPEAITLYKQCFEADSVRNMSSLYYMAVCQRSLGDLAGAEQSLLRLFSQKPEDGLRKLVEKEKTVLQFIRTELSRPDSILFHVNKIDASSVPGAYAAFATDNNNFLLTAVNRDSVEAGLNPYHNRIFTARLNNGIVEKAEALKIDGMNPAFNQGAATMKPDGSIIYFTQWQKVEGKIVSSIFYARKKGNGWSRAMPLNVVNQTGRNSKQPFCSADGQYLFFASDRKGGLGNFDIWYSTLNSDGTTGTPVNAGPVINTAGNEQAPFYHTASATLVFSSDRLPGMGGYDLFSSRGKEATWTAVENMGNPVNSTRDDIYFFSGSKDELLDNALVGSDRGSECCLDIYNITKSAKKKFIAGVVKDCSGNQPMEGAVVVLDNAGNRLTTTTDANGKYLFILNDQTATGQVNVTKDSFETKTAGIAVQSTDVSWLEETMMNADICMTKKQPQIIIENVISIYFDFDKSVVTESGKQQLDSIYNVLASDARVALQISGYTDGRGSETYNKALSDKRAKACANYLIQKGIDPARMTFEAFGACCPVQMEQINGRDNKDGRALNRRALINIIRN
jgi:outer membrane protein OmpA-like peptidoglycan-associated protein/tetratricopeptide (TPR) repeat protein